MVFFFLWFFVLLLFRLVLYFWLFLLFDLVFEFFLEFCQFFLFFGRVIEIAGVSPLAASLQIEITSFSAFFKVGEGTVVLFAGAAFEISADLSPLH